jgi:predicted MFS family arabinose efflux permease
MQALGLLVLAALPVVPVLRGTARPGAADTPAAPPLTVRAALRRARAVPSYWFLNAGFFICGFHIAFLSTHLPGVVAQCGLPPRVAAWSLGVLGLFNVVGSLAMGWAVGRWRMKSLLALVYATRGVEELVFLAAPKTEAVLLAFAAVMGATFLATVPPTAGLVARLFGPANLAMLFGVVMLSHQAGGFLGAWLGAQAFVATGSYDALWVTDALLAFAAALLHLPIREAAPRIAAA